MDWSAAWVLGDPVLEQEWTMAAVRIDEEARKDPRFTLLGERIGGDRYSALGRMIEVWAYCTERQTYFVRADMLDAISGVKNFGNFLVESDLATPLEQEDSCGFYIKGTKGRIEWLKKLRQNAKKGGVARASQKATQKAAQKATQNEAKADPESSPLTLALAPVLVPALVKENTGNPSGQIAVADAPALAAGGDPGTELQRSGSGASPGVGKKGRFTPEIRAAAGRFCSSYVTAYQTRFPGGRPADLWDPVVQGQILNLLRGGFPADRLSELVQVYFQIEDKWFGSRGYSFAAFRANLNRIGQALEAGGDPAGIDWSKVFAGGGA